MIKWDVVKQNKNLPFGFLALTIKKTLNFGDPKNQAEGREKIVEALVRGVQEFPRSVK